jgi:molecular chaperone IbpA
MTRLTTLDFAPFFQNTVGIDQLLNTMINRIDKSIPSQNYPPYNIIKVDDSNYVIEIAVAGFLEGEIDVLTNDGQLVVNGEKAPMVEENKHTFLHQGIGTRKFIRTFELSEYIEVLSALVKNGILVIKLERKIPEAMKPKSIAITYEA